MKNREKPWKNRKNREKPLLFLVFVLLTGNIFAQITVTDTDIVNIGDVIYEALDSVSGSAIQIGPAGANQTWDFSNLQQNDVNIIEHVDPNSTPFGFMHPTSNICAEDDDQNLYMNKSSTGVEMVGFDDVQLLNPLTILPLPLTYPMQYSTGAILALDQRMENSFISFILRRVSLGNPVLPLKAGENPIIGGFAPNALKNEKGERLEEPLLSIDPTKAIGRGEIPEISKW